MTVFERIADAAEKLLQRVDREEQAAHAADCLVAAETWQETTGNAYHQQIAGEAAADWRVRWKQEVTNG